MVKGVKKKLVALTLGVSVTAAGVAAIVKNYQDGDFRPDAYTNSRERNDNQIVFPGQDMSSLGEDTSDESELWEQDQNSDDNLRPEDRPSNSLLFETMKVADASDQSQDHSNENTNDNTTDDTVYVPDTNTSQKTENPSENSKTDVVIIPGNTTGKTDTNTNAKPGTNPDSNGNTDSNGNQNGQNGSGNSGNNGNSGTTNKPSNPSKPSDTNKPTDNGSNNNPGGNEPSGGDDTPSIPEKKDPDTTIPVLPKDDSVFPVDRYPGDDKVDIDGNDDYARYSLAVVPSLDAEDQIYSLYDGEYLNDQRVLCSVLVYVCEDGMWKYRLTELNDNFKVGSYPKQITEDTVELTFYYRPGEDYDWIKGSYTMPIQYSAKLLIEGWNQGEYIAQYMVPKNNTTVPLFQYYYRLMNSMSSDLRAVLPSGIFPGFSETENGTPVSAIYNMTETGAKVLYPLAPTDIGTEYTTTWNTRMVQVNGVSYVDSMQTLTSYSGTSKDLTIPYGIQALEFIYTMDADWNLVYPEFETMTVPETVLRLNQQGFWGVDMETDFSFNVTKQYTVDENNPIYASYDDMLFNKTMTEIYDIPDAKTEVTVPETVDTINFSSENHIDTLHFLSKKPGDFDFSAIRGASIYVPSDVYLKYLSAWGKDPGGNGNQLVAQGDSVEEYVEDDNCVYSADGKTLLAVKNTVDGVLVVPEGVENIAESAFASCGTIDILILPTTMKMLESGSLSDHAPKKIVFLGTTAPEIATDTFADSSMLQVLISAKESYVASWGSILGDGINRIHFKDYQYVDGGATGFSYLNEGTCEADDSEMAGAILLRAPKELTVFNGQSKPDITWKEIAACAFSGCENLTMAELPETVKQIDRGAFAGCNALEGVLAYAKDITTVEEGAFPEMGSLRFVAFNAQELNAYTYYGSAQWYGVYEGSGYEDINRFSPRYYLVSEAGGTLLYGESQESPEESYLLGTTDTVSGTIHLEAGAREIASDVFSGIQQAFTIEGWEHIIAIGDNSFADSGLQGDLVFGSQLVYLGTNAFKDCSGITSLTLDSTGLDESDGYVKFGYYTFMNCDGLKSVTITGNGYYELRDQMFYNCGALESVSFGEEVRITKLGAGAFAQTAIREITIPASVTAIGYAIFDGCTDLTRVTMLSEEPACLASYYHYAFEFGAVQNIYGFLHVPEGTEQAYINAWQYTILGYEEEEADALTDADLLNARNQIRNMLGLEPDEAPGDSDNGENPDAGEEPDFDVPFNGDTESEPIQQGDATPSDAAMEME